MIRYCNFKIQFFTVKTDTRSGATFMIFENVMENGAFRLKVTKKFQLEFSASV